MAQERQIRGTSGWGMVGVLLAATAGLVAAFVFGVRTQNLAVIITTVMAQAAVGFLFAGLTVVNPNQSSVITLFGVYTGSIKHPGFWWVNPLTTRRKLSLRVRNFESSKLKVNDRDGNPIEIAAVVVWRVVETFEASFNVDDYENFVHVQSEAAVRVLATSYPYDAPEAEGISLRHSVGEVTDRLRHEVQDRLAKAGIEVLEARISHLAYAPEIAGAMLRRQQAGAIVAARQKIVDGAIGMVEQALHELNARQVIDLDPERKAAMVSNLLVVLCSDRAVEPVVNAGTLYQ
jgi:regulator of protease activity HflC (stomatin/prohibitin superfamily)